VEEWASRPVRIVGSLGPTMDDRAGAAQAANMKPCRQCKQAAEWQYKTAGAFWPVAIGFLDCV